MKYALLSYLFKEQNDVDVLNVGDYIQSIAARQFLPKVDFYLERELLDQEVPEECKCIMNGWFMHGNHWPPNPLIKPLFVAFHINSEAEKLLLSRASLDYLKNHEPIGCRDKRTERLLKERGIDAYFSACLTLTLGKTYQHTEGNEVLFVDPYIYNKEKVSKATQYYRTIRKGESYQKQEIRKKYGDILPGLSKFEVVSHLMYKTTTIDKSFLIADEILKRYSKAKLVITSRIHCALPCLAMGTPVVYIHNMNTPEIDGCRLDGLLELFKNIIYVNGENIYLSDNFDITSSYNISDIVSSISEKAESFVKN